VLKRARPSASPIVKGANAGALFYNWEQPVERYNMPDTLKAQHMRG
jgi:hypothetical protein